MTSAAGASPASECIRRTKTPAVSLFALKSLLFPAKNIVDLRNAYTPGDLIIFGNFV